MARRPTVGGSPTPATHDPTATHTTAHAHVMHAASHTRVKVKKAKAHKMHKPSRSMRDSLSGISNQDVFHNKGRASGQR